MVRNVLVVSALALGLSACGGSNVQSFLFDRSTPDEFMIVTRAPLSMPPSFELRPPTPGSPRPQEEQRLNETEVAVFGLQGREDLIEGPPASAEEAFLRQAGAVGVDPGIRGVVESETAQLIASQGTLADRLIFWRDPVPAGEIVDANAEAERIDVATAMGDTVTGEGTPTITRRRQAPLEGVFPGVLGGLFN